MPVRKNVAAAAMAGALVVGGAAGALLFGPSLAGAQSTPTAPNTTSGTNGGSEKGSSFTSNEDPTHEAAESPEQEAAESSGQFHHGRGHGSNEDPAHEATESPEREAQEHAQGGSDTQAPPTSSVPAA